MRNHPGDRPAQRVMGNLGGLAGFLLFPMLVWAVVPAWVSIKSPGGAPGGLEAERWQRLAAVKQQQTERVSTPAWVDQAAGKVRIPVDAAAKLVLPELRAGSPKPSAMMVPGRVAAELKAGAADAAGQASPAPSSSGPVAPQPAPAVPTPAVPTPAVPTPAVPTPAVPAPAGTGSGEVAGQKEGQARGAVLPPGRARPEKTTEPGGKAEKPAAAQVGPPPVVPANQPVPGKQ